MKIRLGLFILLLSQSVIANENRVSDFTREIYLANGMKILLVDRKGQPMVSAGWVAHVGSANEKPGITGISHLFEHMMFKGSSRIGTKDNKLDAKLRDELDQLREKMFVEERKYRQQVRLGEAESMQDPTLETDAMKVLKERFKGLIEKQRGNLVNNEFDKIYTEAGASGMNAFTNEDMTVYFIKVPKNKLELWFWMESERLNNPVFREFYSERDVVYEERRLRTESTPTGAQDEVFNSLFWRGHPYGWPVVGWPSDIGAITREQAEDFYDTYYAPNNITLVLVGDFEQNQVLAWARQYFGRIRSSNELVPDVITTRTKALGEVTFSAEVEAPPSVELAYKTQAFSGKDTAALEVLASLLSGKTGRLYKSLVLDQKIATSTGASSDVRKFDGSFSFYATGTTDVSPEQLREALLKEVSLLQDKGITNQELTKVKNNYRADLFRRLQDPFYLMLQLLVYDGLGDWRYMDSSFDKINTINEQDIKNVAIKFLKSSNRANKLYSRKNQEKQTEQPKTLSDFNAEQVEFIEKQLEVFSRLPNEEKAEVAGELKQLRSRTPDKFKQPLDYVISVLQNSNASDLDEKGSEK